ncbi:DUF6075 family protein [Clostridium felsineum]|uniref:DUF6075 family protein n=1 Tax=Clostridium felsineum TaxID=36839 RepID=UPI00098C7A60|nr:DUF6075 family protein [Clostridium felsineum]URZ01934.1 hypothetical protein CLAUR_019310 [Clostridium felsineum]
MTKIFYDAKHEKNYYQLIARTKKDSRENNIFFYNIAAIDSLNMNVDNIYNFEREELNIENINFLLERSSSGECVVLQIALHFFTWKWKTPSLIDVLDSLDKKGYFLLKNTMELYKEVIEI